MSRFGLMVMLCCVAFGQEDRGLSAQQEILRSARSERDPRKAAEILADYLDRFDDNISWTELAARDRFLLIAAHLELFAAADLENAAAKWEERELACIRTFGNPLRYAQMTMEAAKSLLEKDPAASLEYSSKGEVFAAKHGAAWPAFWPLMLEAQVALRQWQAGAEHGEASVREIDAGRLLTRSTDTAEEAKVRRLYAEALDHLSKVDEARVQLSIAAALSADSQGAFEKYLMLHPLRETELEKLESSAKTMADESKERRAALAKAELLASEQKTPATPFALKDLNGKSVSLADYRGKAVVLAFWATWCEPCVGELAELNRNWEKFSSDRRAALLAISIDDTLATVNDSATKRGYRFPILKSDGGVERSYATPETLDGANIPQLYVLDRDGNIRFHVRGYDDDGLFLRKIDWMIEAALR